MNFTVKNHKFDLGRLQEAKAMNIYHQLYNNALYIQATTNDDNERCSNEQCNALINDALALCGHPHYKLSNKKWSYEAFLFLKVFARF